MARDSDGPPQGHTATNPSPRQEEIWIRAFVEYSGTGGVTCFCQADMGGVSLTRAIEALQLGECVLSSKCEGPGAICVFEHESEDDTVEVTVFFDSSIHALEIRAACVVKEENEGEPDAA
ncbi:hypothetical protein [Methyloceanibacter sp. wino2]|uniref:hypothetical protein n=1 Tax=Methyloceanibacter sp. wino2 TaxID=2170729 RepID=UPI000D3E38B3|nr:hypothetical protein [Methyloceanibacter sp. wino2]